MGNFTNILQDVLSYLAEGADFMKDFFSCLPEPLQQLLYAAFVVFFGMATLKMIISFFS